MKRSKFSKEYLFEIALFDMMRFFNKESVKNINEERKDEISEFCKPFIILPKGHVVFDEDGDYISSILKDVKIQANKNSDDNSKIESLNLTGGFGDENRKFFISSTVRLINDRAILTSLLTASELKETTVNPLELFNYVVDLETDTIIDGSISFTSDSLIDVGLANVFHQIVNELIESQYSSIFMGEVVDDVEEYDIDLDPRELLLNMKNIDEDDSDDDCDCEECCEECNCNDEDDSEEEDEEMADEEDYEEDDLDEDEEEMEDVEIISSESDEISEESSKEESDIITEEIKSMMEII